MQIGELFTASRILGLMALLLLVFVTSGVVYLSLMEVNDRRRRKAEQSPGQRKSRKS